MAGLCACCTTCCCICTRPAMAHYARSRYQGRTPTLCSLLNSSQTTSLLRQQQKSSVCDSEHDAGLAALQFTQSQRHPQKVVVEDVIHLGAGAGGLFFGLDQPAAHSGAATSATQGTVAPSQVNELETESARAAIAAQPNTQELRRKRAQRKELLPLDSRASKILHYNVLSRLGQGGLSTVFLAQDERTKKHVALKISTKPLTTLRDDQQPTDIQTSQFARSLYENSWDYRCFCSENETFSRLRCCDTDVSKHGLPQLFDSGLVVINGVRVHSFLVMSLLGNSVYDEIQTGNTKDRAYLCQLAHGMLRSLQYIHSCGLVHRDIKPGNFCLPSSSGAAVTTFIIDFGFVRPIPKQTEKQHQDFEGTPDYASINALNSRRQGPCDDLECLVYALVEMWNGDLLWDVPNVQLWSSEDYEASVRRLYPPEQADRLVRLDPCQRKPLPWDEPNLALMARMRRKEWTAAVNNGKVPRFLQLWLKLVQKLKPWDAPPASLYQQLHDLIDSGLQCDAAVEEEDEEEADWQVLAAGKRRVLGEPVYDTDSPLTAGAAKRAKRSLILSQREV